MKVLKFGGTSVQFAENMRAVRHILDLYANQKILVVLSACRGTTDNLIKLADAAKCSDTLSINALLKTIFDHHLKLINELDFNSENARLAASDKFAALAADLQNIVSGISMLGELTERSRAKILSFGEILSTTIFECYIESFESETSFFDARRAIILNNESLHSVIDFQNTFAAIDSELKPIFHNYDIIVTQGFIGSDTTGHPAVLSRGGSDYSAAVFAAGLGAAEIQIWTDVSGIYTSDPRYYKNACTIPQMTFDEVRKLSLFGAKVLHPDTVKPAIDFNIPVRVLNTLSPHDKGTLLTNSADSVVSRISALAMKKGLYLSKISLPSNSANNEIFDFLLKHISDETTIFDLNISNGSLRLIADSRPQNISGINSTAVVGFCLVGSNLLPNNDNKLLYNEVANLILQNSIQYYCVSGEDSIIFFCECEAPDLLYSTLHNYIIEKNSNYQKYR